MEVLDLGKLEAIAAGAADEGNWRDFVDGFCVFGSLLAPVGTAACAGWAVYRLFS